jgi:hypothetical protein
MFTAVSTLSPEVLTETSFSFYFLFLKVLDALPQEACSKVP